MIFIRMSIFNRICSNDADNGNENDQLNKRHFHGVFIEILKKKRIEIEEYHTECERRQAESDKTMKNHCQ